jgi:hypothetical protein
MNAVEDEPAGPVLLTGVVATGADGGGAAGSGGAAAAGGGGGEATTTGKGAAPVAACPVPDRAPAGDAAAGDAAGGDAADDGAGRRPAGPEVPAAVVAVAGPVVPDGAVVVVVDRPWCGWRPPPGAAPPVPAGGLADEPGVWPRCDPWCVPVGLGAGPGAGAVAGVVVVVLAGAVVVVVAGAVVVVVAGAVVVVDDVLVVEDDLLAASAGWAPRPNPVMAVAATTSNRSSAEWTGGRCVRTSSSFPQLGFAAVAPLRGRATERAHPQTCRKRAGDRPALHWRTVRPPG